MCRAVGGILARVWDRWFKKRPQRMSDNKPGAGDEIIAGITHHRPYKHF